MDIVVHVFFVILRGAAGKDNWPQLPYTALWTGEGREGIIWVKSQAHQLSSNQCDDTIHAGNSFYLFAEGIFLIYWVSPRCWWIAPSQINGDMFEMEMDDQCCEACYPQFLWPRPNTISMNATTPPLKMVTIATKLPESWPLMRTNKDSRVLYPERTHLLVFI